jgi:RNA polymerase sigma-70 factor (ECF subfamily)
LVIGEGLTHREAADALDVKESTISWRLHEIRKRLSEY